MRPRFVLSALAAISALLCCSFISSYLPNGESLTRVVAQVVAHDFGDAPGTYPTTLSSNGARHVNTGSEWLGTTLPTPQPLLGCANSVTVENDAKNVDQDEDDGLLAWWFDPTNRALLSTIYVSVGRSATPGPRYINALIDINQDGDWNDEDEWAVQNLALDLFPGTCQFPVTVTLSRLPEGHQTLSTWVRFTITPTPIPGSANQPWAGTGEFVGGETEDNLITWGPGNPEGSGGTEPPARQLLYLKMECSPGSGSVVPGAARKFVLRSTGSVRPQSLRVVSAGCSGCAAAGDWTPSAGSSFNTKQGEDILEVPAPTGPGAITFRSNAGAVCATATTCTGRFAALYLNTDASAGPVGVAYSLEQCTCRIVARSDDSADLAQVKGRVFGEDGRAIAGANVVVLDNRGSAVGSAVTGDEGNYKIKRIPAGDYVVESFFEAFADLPVQVPKRIAPGGNKLNITLPQPARIRIHVEGKDGDGSPAFGLFTAEIVSLASGKALLRERVDSAGNVYSGPLRSGDYRINVSADGFESVQ
ncbi:MAG TPA: carboxypeptidase-like regulatory domain-containing protein, partial [Blastocatellia bacterium]|nr:carboxypeptidase-like regulatory domain-containing protein [Blastocatellia bacterium]